jgi:hypothetical protein
MESFKSERIVDFFDTYETNFDCLDYLSKQSNGETDIVV